MFLLQKNKKTEQTTTASPSDKSWFIQPKLVVNESGDEYEQEADKVANNITRPEVSEEMNTFFKPAISSLQSGSLQADKNRDGEDNKITASTENQVSSLTGGEPLPKKEKSFFEQKMGYDFSKVTLHKDEAANASAKDLQAKAYTHGNDIVFGANEYKPETTEGKQLIAHELTHVVQQQSAAGAIQREEQKPDRYEELKDDKKAKEVFEKLNPATLGRYCTQNCPAVAEALEEYLKTGTFPETHCDPLGEGNYGYDVGDTEFSDKIVGWDKFWKAASPNLKKHGDFLVIEAERTEKQAKDNNLTQWHYFLVLNIKGKNFVIDAFTKEVNGDLTEYTTRLIANSYRYVKGDFKIKKVRV